MFSKQPSPLFTYAQTTIICLLTVIFSIYLPGFNGSLLAGDKKQKAAELVTDGQPINLQSEKYLQLFAELKKKYNFSQAELEGIFVKPLISKRVLELMDRQWEAKAYYKYAPLFLTQNNIANGRKKLTQYRELLDRIEQKFGVDREVIIAIWGIETQYGARQGSFNVFRTLNTLFAAYPRRSHFFRTPLIHFLLLCRENKIDPASVSGSYAGAFGQTQFIPSSFQAYAVSFDGDNKRDTWNSIPDVLASIANYLKNFNWKLNAPIYYELGHELKDQRLISANLKGRRGRVSWKVIQQIQAPRITPSPGNDKLSIVGLELSPGSENKFRYVAGYPNFIAITKWNNSNKYAMAVTELAEALHSTK